MARRSSALIARNRWRVICSRARWLKGKAPARVRLRGGGRCGVRSRDANRPRGMPRAGSPPPGCNRLGRAARSANRRFVPDRPDRVNGVVGGGSLAHRAPPWTEGRRVGPGPHRGRLVVGFRPRRMEARSHFRFALVTPHPMGKQSSTPSQELHESPFGWFIWLVHFTQLGHDRQWPAGDREDCV